MNVRRASQGDLDALLRLYVQLSPANAGADAARAAEQLEVIARNPGVTLLVAEDGSSVVGTITLVLVPNLTHNARPWAQIENMVVEEAARGGGVGRQLLEACLTLARDAGCYKVQLQSANQRTDAHRFYARLDFVDSSAGFRKYLND